MPTHKPLIPRDLAKYAKPVYQHLANRDLLERCTLGATQNQTESFDLVACQQNIDVESALCPFSCDYCSSSNKEMGMKDLFKGLGIEITQRSSEQHELHDKLWLYKSVKRSEAVAKRRRKEKRGARAAEEQKRKGIHMVLVIFNFLLSGMWL